MSSSDKAKIADVPKGGPLENYRNKASFDWKDLKLFFDDIELITYKVRFVLKTIRNI